MSSRERSDSSSDGGRVTKDGLLQGDNRRVKRMRHDNTNGVGEDLFLSLALHESDSHDQALKRQSMPAKPGPRAETSERPRSSGSRPPEQAEDSFPMPVNLRPFRPALRGRGNSQEAQHRGDSDSRRQTTPTQSPFRPPQSQFEPQNIRYASGPTGLAQLQARNRDWSMANSPEIPRRFSRTPLAEATSRQNRPSRVNTLDTTSDYRYAPQSPAPVLETPMSTPNTTGPRPSDPDSESVDSGPAPSTVWDELDDLKSRIKNLELTGRMPSTSGAAVTQASNDRPRTATTAPTTISSSPQNVRKSSVAPTEINIGSPAAAANIHPLLHNAMAKAKPLISPNVYRALESTANDALNLAAMTGSAGPQGTAFSAATIMHGVTTSDRQIRRKADSMCRNLTDLCIALCEGKNDLAASPMLRNSPANGAFPRFNGDTPPSRYTCRSSAEQEPPTLRSSPSRTVSRADRRRSSLLGLRINSNNSPRDAPERSPYQDVSSPSQNHIDYAARYSRPGTSYLRNRDSRYEDDDYDDPTIRALSRATTEIGHARRQSVSRSEYSQIPRSPGLRDTLAIRRVDSSIAEEATDSPVDSPTPAGQDGARAFFKRNAAPPSEAGSSASTMQRPRRRITSLEQYTASSPRLGGELSRTTSLTSRRRNVVVE